jgi:hypothetical protein
VHPDKIRWLATLAISAQVSQPVRALSTAGNMQALVRRSPTHVSVGNVSRRRPRRSVAQMPFGSLRITGRVTVALRLEILSLSLLLYSESYYFGYFGSN